MSNEKSRGAELIDESRAAERSGGGADLGREKLWGRLAGIAGLGWVVLLLAALMVAVRASATSGGGTSVVGQGGTPRSGGLARQLRHFEANLDLQLLSLGCKVAAYVLLIGLVLFLFSAIRRRNPNASVWQPVLGTLGCLLVIASSIAGYLALADVAQAFVGSGPSIDGRAEVMVTGSTPLRVASVAEIVAQVVVSAWIGWVAYAAMQVGLLTRFLGVFGFAAAVAGVLLRGGAGLALQIGFLGSVAILALGFWPGGRGRAWETGRSEPWE